MKKTFGVVLTLWLGLFSANAALASDTLLGALLGGSVGAIVGNHVGGSDGTLIGGAVGVVAGAIIASENDDDHRSHRGYYAPPPPTRVVHAPAPVYRPVSVQYTHQPPRVVRQPVYVSGSAKARPNQGHNRYNQGHNSYRR